MTIALCAQLCVKVNDVLLREQCGITIEDRCNKKSRITIDSAYFEGGPEFATRDRIGERVKVTVHLMSRSSREVGPTIIEISGEIVSATLQQPHAEYKGATQTFVVEQE